MAAGSLRPLCTCGETRANAAWAPVGTPGAGAGISGLCTKIDRESPVRMQDTKTAITPEVVAEHGLSAEEYKRLLGILGREPSITELGIFSVMWSEPCSSKSSRVWLKTLP